MTQFTLHTAETAPVGSRDEIADTTNKFCFLPNIYAVFADSPAVIKAYKAMTNLLLNGSFSPAEQQLMLLTVSTTNDCGYCVAAHTMGGKREGLDDLVIEAVRTGLPIPDRKMAVLHRFTKLIVENRGWVSNDDIDSFMAAGYSRQQVLEVVLAVSLKTLSNYINHFAETPLDEAFEPVRWRATQTAANAQVA